METQIVLIGISHKTAPVEVREKLAACKNTNKFLSQLICLAPLNEALFLSTCNRVEILFTTKKRVELAIKAVKEHLASFNKVSLNQFENSLYIYQQIKAVKHLFYVASSLDSMVIGESQILGQLKEAYRLGLRHCSTGPILNRLLHKAFFVTKRVRTETKLAHHPVSVSYAAVKMAKKIFSHFEKKTIMLIGAGEMAELAVQCLLDNGAKTLIIANRTLERALELARIFKGKAISMGEIKDALKEVDIVITSTGAPNFILLEKDIKQIMPWRRHRPLFFIDAAVPRDVDPKINQIENAYVYDIDDLEGVVEQNKIKREKEAQKAMRIVEEETIKFKHWLETLTVVPTVIALKRKFEEIKHLELNRTFNNLKHLSEVDKETIAIMAEAIIKKILHDPINLLKQKENIEKIELYLDITRHLFALDLLEKTHDKDYHTNK
jgi:glutamyl-tRNA reductase